MVAVIAATAIGIAGTAPSWFDGYGSSDNQSGMAGPHMSFVGVNRRAWPVSTRVRRPGVGVENLDPALSD